MTYPLLIGLEFVVPESRIDGDDVVCSPLSQRGLYPVFGVLDVLLNERDRKNLFPFVGTPTRGGGDTGMDESVELLEHFGFLTTRLLGCVVSDIEVLFQAVHGRRT